MKILHITNNYPTLNFPIFGIFVKEQVNSLINLGLDIEVFFINGREKGIIEYIKSIFVIHKKIKKNKYDIIHCHHSFSALTLLLASILIRKKFKSVISFQSDPKNELFGILYGLIKRNFDLLIFKNKPNYIDKKIRYMPNGVDQTLFKPFSKKVACEYLTLDFKKNYILFVSSNKIRREKRFDLFEKTIQVLKNKYPELNFEMIKMINTKRSDVPYYFNASSVHLLTSDFEGSPNSVKESLFCNTPVVSTNVGNVKDILNGLYNCYISKTNDPLELAELVINAINNNKFDNRKKIIEKGYSIVSVAKKIESFYNELINKKL